ncbi:MAG: nitric oxide synthase oxygenase [Pseudomonadota bacterium]
MVSSKDFGGYSEAVARQSDQDEPSPYGTPVATEFHPVEASSFFLKPSADPISEGRVFLKQLAKERGKTDELAQRLIQFAKDTKCPPSKWYTADELSYGAQLAWRNSVRCVGRVFWRTLEVFDARDCISVDAVVEAIFAHMAWSTNDGDLRPALTVFTPDEPKLRIINPQLILYAGYVSPDGSISGDPKNTDLTALAQKLGWRGNGTAFDVLPLILRRGSEDPVWFDIPKNLVLEVPIRHPDNPAVEQLGLKWFAMPAVSGMALDMGGVSFTAAPSSGVYQGTEIGSFNLGDQRRYNMLPQIATAFDLNQDQSNPMWKDQALVELNRAVLHSFEADGVKIMNHHALSESFRKFCVMEDKMGREVHGHWPWIVPPMSSNLSWIWHEEGFKKTILKPGYFYQPFPDDLL